MGVFLRVFDPKGFQNPYKKQNWREVGGPSKVDQVEDVRTHRMRTELPPVTAEQPPTAGEPSARTQARVKPPEPGEESAKEVKEKEEGPHPEETTLDETEEPPPPPDKTTLKKAKEPTDFEKDFSTKKAFYGPGDITTVAESIMQEEFEKVRYSDPISEVEKILKKYTFSHLPVISEQDTICGLITQDQIFQKLVDEDIPRDKLDKMEASEIMISPVLCCLMETPIEAVFHTVLKERVGFLPVVDSKDKLRGIISKDDLIRYVYESSHYFESS